MRLKTLLVLWLLTATPIIAQNFEWAKSFGASVSDDKGSCIVVDASGNVYTTGHFSNTVDFDPGAGTYNLSASGTSGKSDIFVQKLDASGNFIWAKRFGASDHDKANSIAVDASGNVYVTGFFVYTVDFDPGTGTYNLTSEFGFNDIFILKLDASGSFVWAKRFGESSSVSDEGRSIAVDASGNVYTMGNFAGTIDFDPGTGVFNLSSPGGSNIFLQKMDASGNFLWAKSFSVGTTYPVGTPFSVDASQNVYMTGEFYGTVDIDPSTNTYNITSLGESDIFVLKLDASGGFLWANAFGGSYFDEGKAITIDPSGNVYSAGRFSNTVDFDPGVGTNSLTSNTYNKDDVFIQKVDASGSFIWAKSFGSITHDVPNAIALDGSNNVYSTGYFYYTVDFDPGAGTFELSSSGASRDQFVHKMNTEGEFLWAKSIGSNDEDEGLSIRVDASDNVITTGYFSATVDFDPGVGTFNLTSTGYYDGFIQKISQGTVGIDENTTEFDFTISPNPTNGNVSIEFGSMHENTQITITDITGRSIYSKSITSAQKVDFSIEGYAGIYFAVISSEDKNAVIKIVKE